VLLKKCFLDFLERRIFEKDNTSPLKVLLSWHEGMKKNHQASPDAFVSLSPNLSAGHKVIARHLCGLPWKRRYFFTSIFHNPAVSAVIRQY